MAAPRDSEASGGGRPGVPGEARAGTNLSRPAPWGARYFGREAAEGQDPWLTGVGRGGLRPGPPASP